MDYDREFKSVFDEAHFRDEQGRIEHNSINPAQEAPPKFWIKNGKQEASDGLNYCKYAEEAVQDEDIKNAEEWLHHMASAYACFFDAWNHLDLAKKALK